LLSDCTLRADVSEDFGRAAVVEIHALGRDSGLPLFLGRPRLPPRHRPSGFQSSVS